MQLTLRRTCLPSSRVARSTSIRKSFDRQHFGSGNQEFVKTNLSHYRGHQRQKLRTCNKSAAGEGNSTQGKEDGDEASVSASSQDWREFRARMIQLESSTAVPSSTPARWWAHAVTRPETGCLLIAHPSMFTQTQTYFYQAVIFIVEHNEKLGSAGVILNRPSDYRLRDLDIPLGMMRAYNDCVLYVGGDVDCQGRFTMLHNDAGLEGASEVVKGVYVGGEEAGSRAISVGTKQPEDFRWFMNYAGWGPGQLAAECAAGVWFTAAASPDLVLSPASAVGGGQLWYTVLELMGGDYRVLAQEVRERWDEIRGGAAAREDGSDAR